MHQNPNIQKQLETGRMKAEETVMRLKKQKEEQEDRQKRTMENIVRAASKKGISLNTTNNRASVSTPPVSNSGNNTNPTDYSKSVKVTLFTR